MFNDESKYLIEELEKQNKKINEIIDNLNADTTIDEVTRQQNELIRQQNEVLRQEKELERVQAENERKAYFEQVQGSNGNPQTEVISQMQQQITNINSQLQVIPEVQQQVSDNTSEITNIKSNMQLIPSMRHQIASNISQINSIKTQINVIPTMQGQISDINLQIENILKMIEDINSGNNSGSQPEEVAEYSTDYFTDAPISNFNAVNAYYLSPTGSDSNNGTSRSTPFLTVGKYLDIIN